MVQPIAWEQVQTTFRQIWGYDQFREPQGEVIRSLLDRRDTLIVMPTGGGKSLCFQLPALLQTGLTLVISPLVALMENQVQELRQRRLPAALLHSELPKATQNQTLRAIEHQELRLLYLSPETLLRSTVWERLCRPDLLINGLILDEAHCLVQWGDSFRPAYRRLGTVRPALLQHKPPGSQIAIAAFTATADPHAQGTIQSVLQLQKPQIFLINPYRANLHLKVQIAWTRRCRRDQLLQVIRRYPQKTGLIYIRTRRDSEALATWLQGLGWSTAAYHAGLSPSQRRRIEQAWLEDELQFVVCTCAFGMGINKPDVRWVVHFQVPLLLSEYVQEMGRAGRDGDPAEAVALVSEPTGWLDSDDRDRQQFFLKSLQQQQRIAQSLVQQLPDRGTVQAISREFREGELALGILHSLGQLTWQDPFQFSLRRSGRSTSLPAFQAAAAMDRYLRTRQCRWQFLLQAFGFTADAQGFRCGHCDRCQGKG